MTSACLITGRAGSTDFHFVHKLIEKGYIAVVVADFSTGKAGHSIYALFCSGQEREVLNG